MIAELSFLFIWSHGWSSEVCFIYNFASLSTWIDWSKCLAFFYTVNTKYKNQHPWNVQLYTFCDATSYADYNLTFHCNIVCKRTVISYSWFLYFKLFLWMSGKYQPYCTITIRMFIIISYSYIYPIGCAWRNCLSGLLYLKLSDRRRKRLIKANLQ